MSLFFPFLQLLHTHMYSITRPVRLGLVSLLPFFQSFGLDFLHQDCLIENPLLSPEERCPCTHVKHPTFFTINSTHSHLPHDMLQLPLSEVHMSPWIHTSSGINLQLIISKDMKIVCLLFRLLAPPTHTCPTKYTT